MTRRYKERNLTPHSNEDQVALFFDTYISHWNTKQLQYLRSLIDMELRIHEMQFDKDDEDEFSEE